MCLQQWVYIKDTMGGGRDTHTCDTNCARGYKHTCTAEQMDSEASKHTGIHMCTRVHRCTCALANTHKLSHSPTDSPTDWRTHSLTHSLTPSPVQPPTPCCLRALFNATSLSSDDGSRPRLLSKDHDTRHKDDSYVLWCTAPTKLGTQGHSEFSGTVEVTL